MRILAIISGEYGQRHVDNLREHAPSNWTIEVWQAPGILSDEAYWQLTAFLVDANGIAVGETPLGFENAADVRLAPQSSQTQAPVDGREAAYRWLALLAAGTAALLASGVVTRWRRNRAH